MNLPWLSLIVLAGLLPACATASRPPAPVAPPPVVMLPPDLDRVLRDYEQAWRAGDAAGLAALFAVDGFVLSNGATAVRGRDAIRAAYADASGDLRLAALASSVGDDHGYIVGVYWYGPQPDVSEQGKFLLALRREPGGPWLIAADMDYSDPWTW